MSEYDAWAPVYDAWASDMTEDVAHYVSLAREADGPIVELMVGSGRVAIEVGLGITEGNVAGDRFVKDVVLLQDHPDVPPDVAIVERL